MTFEILRKEPIKFYKQNGICFFEPFHAADKYKRPLNVEWRLKPESSAIIAKSTYIDDVSIYDMALSRSKDEFKGISIVANPKHKEIGEVLNLASLITFKENLFSNYKVFALRDSVQFYAKYGFNLLSSNINEVIHNLKFLSKAKEGKFADMKDSAGFFIKQIENKNGEERLMYISHGNNLVSDYIRELARDGKKIDRDDLYNHTHMQFSTLDTIRNRDFLNALLDKHEINYKI